MSGLLNFMLTEQESLGCRAGAPTALDTARDLKTQKLRPVFNADMLPINYYFDAAMS